MTRRARYLLAFVTLVAAAVLLRGLTNSEAVPITHPLQGLSSSLGAWRGETDYFDQGTVDALHVDDYILRRYQASPAPGTELWLYVGYWGAQRLGQERVHSPSVCLPGAGWVISQPGIAPVRLADRTILVNRDVIEKGDERQLVLYWYQIHGRVVAKELPATAVLAWTSLTQHRSDEALVRINAPIVGSMQATLDREIGFVQTAFPALAHLLPD